LESLPVDPTLLERANWWFDISWYGILLAGAAAAVAACATVAFLFIQFWSSGIREQQANWRTSTLEVRAKTADAELAKANAEIAEAKRQAAALENDAAQARVEQERLKAIAAWRRITREQYDILLAHLKGQSIKVQVDTVGSDYEAIQYFDDIVQTLKDAGLEIVATTRMITAIGLGVSDKDFQGKGALKRAFADAGLPLTEVQNTPQGSGGIGILIVGSKPPPF
jgi:hypothetical protein